MKAHLYINGQWVEGTNSFTAINPSTGEPLGAVYQASEIEVNAAVAAAQNALPVWSKFDATARAEVLGKVVDLIIARYGEQGKLTGLKDLIMTEMGKRLPEADIEVIETSDMIAFFVKEAPRLLAPTTPELNQDLWSTKKSKIIYDPVGVIGVIKPWNYPLELPIWAIAPALVAGNTVVFKPSEYSSFVGLEIGRLFEEAGLPPGVLNIITGDGEVGKMLVRHEGIDMISFTGGVSTGREIATECGKQLKKCSLELGGNDPAIVEPDVDLELAANGLVWGAFCNSGQVCVSANRVFVHQQIADELIKRIIDKTKALRIMIDFGPIISAEQLAIVEEQVNDAVSKGATVLVGGKRVEHSNGYYYSPTVITNVSSSMRLMTEECFGPVLPIVTVADTEEGVELANRSEYGLGASVWTSDLEKGQEIAKTIQSGMVWINDVNVAFPETPWGGVKCSGIGTELSEWGLYEYVQRKHINVETSTNNRRDWWYPYQENSAD
jgi:succinate-semialdehyde dehydrogenase/glutarate-semialdehyde dehydrogenase